MSKRPELPEVLEHVRGELRAMAGAYRRRGLRVAAVEADVESGKPFPDLLVYLAHEKVGGERVGRFSLEHNGHLMDPGDAAGSVGIGLLEITAQEVARLPLARES